MTNNIKTFGCLGTIAAVTALSITAFASGANAMGKAPEKVAEPAKQEATEAAKKVAEQKATAAKDAEKTVVAEAKPTEGEKPARAKPEFEDGKFIDEEGNPTYYMDPESKKWDWYAYAGNRTYHAECHVCHGPFGLGSTFAPKLADSLKDMTYEKFQEVVINGQKNVWGASNSVMPAFGVNKGVYCRLDDLYVYLKARASGDLAPIPTRSMKKVGPSKEYREYVAECLGDEG